MNKDILKGKMDQLSGNLQQKWGKLTDDDITKIKGDSKIFIGKMKEYYGMTKEEAEKAWKEFTK